MGMAVKVSASLVTSFTQMAERVLSIPARPPVDDLGIQGNIRNRIGIQGMTGWIWFSQSPNLWLEGV
jgi:hypothetical protein